jgi:hypothetical protein
MELQRPAFQFHDDVNRDVEATRCMGCKWENGEGELSRSKFSGKDGDEWLMLMLLLQFYKTLKTWFLRGLRDHITVIKISMYFGTDWHTFGKYT